MSDLSQLAQLGAKMVAEWREKYLASPRGLTGPTGPLADAFVKLALSPSVHAWLVETGWSSDGSSSSLDNIEGVRIGKAGTDFNRLPATVHDRGYELSRRLGGLARGLRIRMDREYRDRCIAAVTTTLIGFSQRKGVARAHARYLGLRLGAWASWSN